MKTKTRRVKKLSRAEKKQLIEKAKTFGLPELGWIHGGTEHKLGCCGWSSIIVVG